MTSLKNGRLLKGFAPEVAHFEDVRVCRATVSLFSGCFHKLTTANEINILRVSGLLRPYPSVEIHSCAEVQHLA